MCWWIDYKKYRRIKGAKNTKKTELREKERENCAICWAIGSIYLLCYAIPSSRTIQESLEKHWKISSQTSVIDVSNIDNKWKYNTELSIESQFSKRNLDLIELNAKSPPPTQQTRDRAYVYSWNIPLGEAHKFQRSATTQCLPGTQKYHFVCSCFNFLAVVILTEAERRLAFGAFVRLKWQSTFRAYFFVWFLSFGRYNMGTYSHHTIQTFVVHAKIAIGTHIRCLYHAPNNTRAMITMRSSRCNWLLMMVDKMMSQNDLNEIIAMRMNAIPTLSADGSIVTNIPCTLMWPSVDQYLHLPFHAGEIVAQPNAVQSTCVRPSTRPYSERAPCIFQWHCLDRERLHLDRVPIAIALWSDCLGWHAIYRIHHHRTQRMYRVRWMDSLAAM